MRQQRGSTPEDETNSLRKRPFDNVGCLHAVMHVHSLTTFRSTPTSQSMLSQDFDDDDMPNVVWMESPKGENNANSQQVYMRTGSMPSAKCMQCCNYSQFSAV